MTVYLHGMGHFHPPTVLDNAFFEDLGIDTSSDWILDRVGIHQRRSVLTKAYLLATANADLRQAAAHSTHTLAELAAPAVTMALQRAGITASQLGMVVASSCSPSHLVPAVASVIAATIGASQAVCLDMNSSCSSFAMQLHWLNQMQSPAVPEYVLLVQAENWSTTIDYRDRSTCVLVGDAAAATVVSTRHEGRAKLLTTTVGSDPTSFSAVQTPVHHPFTQQGRAVQKFAIKRTVATFEALSAQLDQDLSQHHFIGHQANLTMLQAVAKRIGVDSDCHHYHVDRFGNCAAAGAPSVLSHRWDRFQSNDRVSVVVVGAGLTWGGAVVVF